MADIPRSIEGSRYLVELEDRESGAISEMVRLWDRQLDKVVTMWPWVITLSYCALVLKCVGASRCWLGGLRLRLLLLLMRFALRLSPDLGLLFFFSIFFSDSRSTSKRITSRQKFNRESVSFPSSPQPSMQQPCTCPRIDTSHGSTMYYALIEKKKSSQRDILKDLSVPSEDNDENELVVETRKDKGKERKIFLVWTLTQ